MRNFRFLSTAGIISALLFAAPTAFAWDGVATGTISTFQVTQGGNYGFRVTLNNMANMCTGGPGWAYLNDTDSNYKTYVAAILYAKAQGSNVTVYSTLEGIYCHIGYISVG